MVMSPIGDSYRGWNGAAQNVAARRLALEKPSATSGLGADTGEQTQTDSFASQNSRAGNPHHSGTVAAVPLRHETDLQTQRLVSAFVAQLLGQLLPETASPPLGARRTYESAEAPLSLLLDTRL